MRRQMMTHRQYVWGILSPLILVGVTISLAFLATSALKSTGVMWGQWSATPTAQVCLFGGVSFISLGMVSAVVGPRVGFWGGWSGLWTWASVGTSLDPIG